LIAASAFVIAITPKQVIKSKSFSFLSLIDIRSSEISS